MIVEDCPEPDWGFPVCDIAEDSAQDIERDEATGRIAAAIQAAAVAIIGGDCHVDEGTEWGDVEVGKCCSIVTMIQPPAVISGECYMVGDYLFRLRVTFDREKFSTAAISAASSRLGRKVVAQACCLLKPEAGTGRMPFNMSIVGTDNIRTGECRTTTITVSSSR